MIGASVMILGLAILGLQGLRLLDGRTTARAWKALMSDAAGSEKVFDLSAVQDLPEAARRYFLFMIKPGTVLRHVAEISMSGELGLGSKKKPNYVPMHAHQLLAPPFGFVWRIEAGRGLLRFSGSDGYSGLTSWTSFWLQSLLPVVRAGRSQNHLLASFGRVVAEAAFWVPASLLPGENVVWETLSCDRAKAVVTSGGLRQEIEIEVAPDGRPISVLIQRWSNANPQKIWRTQPFGGTLSDFREFEGYLLPTRVDGGNHFGTDDYFPFYRARVQEIGFPKAGKSSARQDGKAGNLQRGSM